jgi:hypothetical protein
MGGEEVSMAYRFKCSKCDKWHEGIPDVAYDRPLIANEIPDEEKTTRLFLTTDLCVVDSKSFFIRCLLAVPIKGTGENFGWAIWSSLSEKNFLRYRKHYDDDMSDWEPMFGYLSNRLPEYPDTLSLKLSVQTRAQGDRPTVIMEPTDHPLAVDQREGMSLELALKIVDPFLH